MAPIRQIFIVACCAAGLAACQHRPPAQAYANRGDPESLVNINSELMSVDLTGPQSLSELSDAIAKKPPTRAVLHCADDTGLCLQAKNFLDKKHIALLSSDEGNSVTLMYDQISARDCENRYIDNSINDYNLEPATFGCSVKANMVQMVTDKREFVSPGLLSYRDGEKTAQTYSKYLNPPAETATSGSAASSSSLIGATGSTTP